MEVYHIQQLIMVPSVDNEYDVLIQFPYFTISSDIWKLKKLRQSFKYVVLMKYNYDIEQWCREHFVGNYDWTPKETLWIEKDDDLMYFKLRWM